MLAVEREGVWCCVVWVVPSLGKTWDRLKVPKNYSGTARNLKSDAIGPLKRTTNHSSTDSRNCTRTTLLLLNNIATEHSISLQFHSVIAPSTEILTKTSHKSATNMAASNPTTLTPIDSESAFHDAVTQLPASCLAVIYFHAPWAEPCKQMSTILTTLASTYSQSTPPTITFLSLDAEEVSDISEEYDVSQVPFVVLQKDGKVLERVTGTDAGKVRSAVERHAGSGSGNAGGVGLPPAQKVTKTQGSGGDVDMDNSGQADGMAKYAPGASDEAGAPSKEELDTRLGELVKAAPVMLFMKGTPSAPQCGFSRQTVSILREKGVRYGFFNILADDEVRQGLKEYSDWPTFPQVYVGGELIGGLDIVSEIMLNEMETLLTYDTAQGGV